MIWLILFLALILRLVNLNQSLWLDEAINIVYAKTSAFWWFVTKYPVGDFHPPGWFAILWVWGHIFGFAEISARFPSVIFGIATVGLTFLLGKELFNKKIGILSAVFLAIAPLHVYYSQEARMYIFAAFTVTLSFYFLSRMVLRKKWAEVGFIISLVMVLYSDYLAYLIIPAQLIYLVWIRKMSRRIIIYFLAASAALIPWLSIFLLQLQSGINTTVILPGWAEVVGGVGLKDLLLIPVKFLFGRVTLADKTLYMAIAGGVGAIFGSIFLFGFKKIDPKMKLLISWLIIPLALAVLISFFIPVLSYFRIIFILPSFYLILAKGVDALPKKLVLSAFIFICLTSFISLAFYYLNPDFQREDWRAAVRFISQKMDSQTLIIFENTEIPAPVRYYAGNLSSFKPGLSQNLTNDLTSKEKVFLFEYLKDIYDPKRLVEQKLQKNNFIEKKTYDFPGVGFVREYVKL